MMLKRMAASIVLQLKHFLKDSADANNIGVYSLYVVRAEDSDIRFAYWGDGNWTPGINIDEAKE